MLGRRVGPVGDERLVLRLVQRRPRDCRTCRRRRPRTPCPVCTCLIAPTEYSVTPAGPTIERPGSSTSSGSGRPRAAIASATAATIVADAQSRSRVPHRISVCATAKPAAEIEHATARRARFRRSGSRATRSRRRRCAGRESANPDARAGPRLTGWRRFRSSRARPARRPGRTRTSSRCGRSRFFGGCRPRSPA